MLFKKKLIEYNRYQAFAAHLSLSLVIFLVLSICITQHWYPGLLFEAGSGWKAIGIIIGIDLILGPVLTLMIFNSKKRNLKFDLMMIAILQFSALIYGSWVIFQSRPIAIVYIGSSFHVFHANSTISGKICNLAKENDFQLYYQITSASITGELKPEQFHPYTEYQEIIIKERMVTAPLNPYLVPLEKAGQQYTVKLDKASGVILSIATKKEPK